MLAVSSDVLDRGDRGITVLVVDDEVEVGNALRRVLGRSGFEVAVATGAAEGFAVLARLVPDVVISDWRMPGMQGPEFLEQVRLRAPFAARLLISGQADGCRDAAAAAGLHVVAKPWDNEELVALLRRVLAERGAS